MLAWFIFAAPLVVALTSLISGLFGLAGGMLMLGIFAAIIPVPQAMLLHGITQCAVNIFRGSFFRRSICWRNVGWYSLGSLLSAVVVVRLAFIPDKHTLFLSLGALALIGALIPNRLPLDFSKPRHAFFCGLLTTGLSLVSGSAGGLFDLFFVRGSMNRFQILGTKSAAALISQLLKVCYFGAVAVSLGDPATTQYLALAPALILSGLVGTYGGRLLVDRISESQFRLAGRVLVFCTGAFFFSEGLFTP